MKYIILLALTLSICLAQDRGNGKTTRYWDCCKPSCAWQSNVPPGYKPVKICNRDGSPANKDSKNICGGGGGATPGYMCVD